MARLYLKFEKQVIREVVLTQGVVTIGRQPDNLLRIDNPAVSGHHARVYWKDGHYVLEDTQSFNGTYVNNRSIGSAVLTDQDVIAIGKHTIVFCERSREELAATNRSFDRSVSMQQQAEKARVPQLDPTMVLDTRKAREMLAKAAAAGVGGAVATEIDRVPAGHCSLVSAMASSAISGRGRIGRLTILKGKTDRQHYLLPSKLNVIGRSKLATIRLKRWFAPRIAASIQLQEDRYFIVPAGKPGRITINDKRMDVSQQELRPGDVVEVAGVQAKFDYNVTTAEPQHKQIPAH